MPRRWGAAFCSERGTNGWTTMAKERQRAPAKTRVGGKRGCDSQADTHSSFRGFVLGVLKAGTFLGGLGEKGVAWGW